MAEGNRQLAIDDYERLLLLTTVIPKANAVKSVINSNSILHPDHPLSDGKGGVILYLGAFDGGFPSRGLESLNSCLKDPVSISDI